MPGELDASHLGPRDPYRGRVLAGRFELESRIGSGSMGHVYRATDRASGSTCAIKILRPELLADWSLIKRFHREGRAAQAIDSPHVVRILEYGESEDDVLFIAMEYLGGQTLAAWIEREGKAPLPIAIGVVRAIAEALRAAHAAGVTHRDLKPENVVLGPGGGVKVVDFGIARIAEGSRAASEIAANVTIAGSLMGTPLYMSPEAAGRKQVGPAADVYALGVIAYELLTGEPPFLHDNPMRVVGMHLRVPAPRLRETLADQVPEPLDELVAELMAKEPEGRPSAASAKYRLDAIADALGIELALPIDTLRDVEVPSDVAAVLRAGGVEHDAATVLTAPREGDRTLEDPPPRPRVITGERLVPTIVVPPSGGPAAPTVPPTHERRKLLAIGLAVALALIVIGVAVATLRRGGEEPVSPDEQEPASGITSEESRAPDRGAPSTDHPLQPTGTETGTETETQTETATETEAETEAAPAAKRPRAKRPRPPRRPPPARPAVDLDIARDYE